MSFYSLFREKETQSLKQQIDFLNEAIAKEEDKAKNLEERSKVFSAGQVGSESQEKLLDELNHKVKEVYRRCIGDSDANLSTLQMLTNIENKLENLFEAIEQMPPEKVEQAEKVRSDLADYIIAERQGTTTAPERRETRGTEDTARGTGSESLGES